MSNEVKELTPWQKFFDKDYLGSHNFEYGEEKTVTIATAEEKSVKMPGGKSSLCIVISFEGEDVKPMVVGNVTNSKSIQAINGSQFIENWPGTKLVLYVDGNVKFGGKEVGGIRIREGVKPEPQKAQLHEKHNAWSKCVEALAVKGYDIKAIRKKYNVSEDTEKALVTAADAMKLKQ